MFDRENYEREYRDRLKEKAFSVLGGKCVQCGFSDYRALEIDHIIPPGSKSRERPRGRTTYREIALHGKIDNLQLLCCNCHAIKTHDNGEFSPISIRSTKIVSMFKPYNR